MSKYQLFYTKLLNVVSDLDTTEVKAAIGDSVNNNRTLTVGQVARFLTEAQSNIRGGKTLGKNLINIYSLLRDDIVLNRTNNRTDAIDINEFFNYYESVVIGSGEFRRPVSSNLI